MKISKARRASYEAIAARGGKALPPLFSRFCIAIPILSGKGHDGPQTYFMGWRVYYVELSKTTAQKAVFYALETIRDDKPAEGYPIIEKAIKKGLLVDPHSFILDLSPAELAELE